MPKTPAQKIRDYLKKRYGNVKDIFIRGKASINVRVSDVQGKYQKK